VGGVSMEDNRYQDMYIVWEAAVKSGAEAENYYEGG
jgi:hypothetical protein